LITKEIETKSSKSSIFLFGRTHVIKLLAKNKAIKLYFLLGYEEVRSFTLLKKRNNISKLDTIS